MQPTPSRGPKLKSREKLKPSDSPGLLLGRLGRMARQQDRLARIRAGFEALAAILRGCPSLDEAIRDGAKATSLSEKIRHIRNDLELTTGRLCNGALYRSAGVAALAREGRLDRSLLRLDHAVPARTVAGMLYLHLRDAPPRDLAAFVLQEAVVCAITKEEEALAFARSGLGSLRQWREAHPDYNVGSAPGHPGARPFLRHAGSGIGLTFWPTGEEVDPRTDTLAAHLARVRKLNFYRPATYWGD